MKIKNILIGILSFAMCGTFISTENFSFINDFQTFAVSYIYSGYLGVHVTYDFDINTGVLTISSDGVDGEMFFDNTNSFENNNNYVAQRIKSVIIEDGITNISPCLFKNCENLQSITIPESVTNIGYGAFEGTPFIEKFTNDFIVFNNILYKYQGTQTDITIPEGITRICGETFDFINDTIEYISLPSTLKQIDSYAFTNLTSLKELTIPYGVTYIGKNAFQNCKSLESIIVPSSVNSLDNSGLSYNNQDLIIYGVKNSSAEKYAIKEDLNFIEILEYIPKNVLILKKYLLGISKSPTNLDFNCDENQNILDLIILKNRILNN